MPVTIKMSAHHIHPLNSPPVKIVICGSTPELGNWDVSKGVELKSFAVSSHIGHVSSLHEGPDDDIVRPTSKQEMTMQKLSDIPRSFSRTKWLTPCGHCPCWAS